ncbi:MAG: [glutamine synthetase] adenylyltransferase / [glutamine synthetase]-adenylyl-L-tyrosine [Actinomycetota bacterium]|nr:[glutamine synthetase] adenylyltransferase / [glutamine synthetase]-adenylyl-L-tyrosine [Actinomycetota bacterium]
MGQDPVADAVDRSAAPDAVALALDQLEELHPGARERLADAPQLRAAVVAVTAASRFLTRLVVTDAAALGVLAALDAPPAGTADLARWKRLELLRIAARDLTGKDGFDDVGAALAHLAETVLQRAWEQAGAPDLAIIGMGKLGGEELNYASDIDLMFVGEGDARPVIDIARTCFRVDTDLRPEGRDGPLMRSLDSYQAYWDRWAQTWEFQALLKARPVAGRADLGTAFAATAADRVWQRRVGADELREMRAMKARVEGDVARQGLSERELKRGPGGIRDVEFSVQLLQLVHGRQDEALRARGTLPALAELGAAGFVAPEDAAALASAYRYLRTVEHRLQLVDEQQVHALPVDETARTHLARVIGHRDRLDASALEQFDDEMRGHQATTRRIHERLYFRPLLEAFAGSPGAMSIDAAEARLIVFGFRDADRTRQALRELTGGLTRTSRLMQQMLPLLLGWLSEAPDPDLGLLGLRSLAGQPHRAASLVATFRESPEAARRLCLTLGTSRLFLEGYERQPELIGDLADDGALATPPRKELVERAATALAWRSSPSDQARGLQRLQRIETIRTAARDVLGLDEVEDTAESLTGLAEATIEAALAAVEPPGPMAVIAMGRFGGAELSYASDLDVLLVYDASSHPDVAEAERAAERLMRFMKGDTPAARVYLLDADLRPEGKQGPLARSLEGYRTYYERWAQTWERQALVRARPAAGDEDVGRRFMGLVDRFVWTPPLLEEQVREIRRMKARIERERIPAGDDPQFHLKLGRGSLSDVEWTAQLLQLRHGVRRPGTIAALRALTDAGVLAPDDADVLIESYRFCERTRNRWYLVKGAPGDALPAQADQLGRLARSLDVTPADLRNEYKRVTRRARQVMERLFYGREEH